MKSAIFVFVGFVALVGLPAFFSMLQASSHELEAQPLSLPQASSHELDAQPLSLKEALGQTLLIGFKGKEMNPDLETVIKRMQPGGVLLLGRNIESQDQIKTLIEELQEVSRVPLFVAVDQEGGIVSRIWWGEATSQAELENQIDALKVGRVRAQQLQALGFNMNLAPVLDSSSLTDYLFPRSFQTGSLFSALFASTLMYGHEQEGVLSVPKHYPGYDAISFNPETSVIPRVKEFPPAEAFSHLFFRLAPSILMLSHAVYEDIDDENLLPFSERGIAKVKKNAGEHVLLMSDDLLSIAIVKQYSLQELGSQALLSGVDILLVVGNPREEILGEFYNGLWERAKENPVLAERIYDSAKRILELKLALFEAE